jgi:dTDP-4-amino-4,6-dideoxygalactose transaminase
VTIVQTRIPFLDVSAEIGILWDELTDALEDVLRSGRFILGPKVAEFEEAVARYLDAPHAVGLNSGTDALKIALQALSIGPGDEVVTTPFTFVATAEAVSAVGATPVFADIDSDSFNIDPAAMLRAITPRTKAVIPVHLFGHPARMADIMPVAQRHGLRVVEDCAQAFGAQVGEHRVGVLGDAGAFSFFPTKNLGGIGDGGMMVSADGAVAESARMLRAHGSRRKNDAECVGYNSRLDELQAAILLVKLRHANDAITGRQRVVSRYRDLLQEVDEVSCPSVVQGYTHSFNVYTLRVHGGRRDLVAARLRDLGVDSMIYYRIPLHKTSLYDVGESFPVAEQAAAEVLSLPIWPTMSDGDIQVVARALKESVRH